MCVLQALQFSFFFVNILYYLTPHKLEMSCFSICFVFTNCMSISLYNFFINYIIFQKNLLWNLNLQKGAKTVPLVSYEFRDVSSHNVFVRFVFYWLSLIKMIYKWSVVPPNTSKKTSNKLFVSVPKDIKLSLKWLILVHRNLNEFYPLNSLLRELL